MHKDGIDVICLFYDEKRLKHFISIVCRVQSWLRPKKIAFVTNNSNFDVERLDAQLRILRDYTIVEHNNTGMEFGGYQAGIDALGDTSGGILVMNDTVGVHDFVGPKKLRETTDRIQSLIEPKFAVGDICVDISPIRILEFEGLVWLRSNLFYLDPVALKSIDRRLYCPTVNDLINDSGATSFVAAEADPRITALIDRWLFKPGPYAWYRAQPLSNENWDFMARKARSILQERYLSMRLLAQGTTVHNTGISLRSMIYDRLTLRIERAIEQ